MTDPLGFFLLPQPIKGPPKRKNPRKDVRKTLKGKVVYKRKPHIFSIKDAFRILRKILFYSDNDKYIEPTEEFDQEWIELFLWTIKARSIRDGFEFDPTIWRQALRGAFWGQRQADRVLKALGVDNGKSEITD